MAAVFFTIIPAAPLAWCLVGVGISLFVLAGRMGIFPQSLDKNSNVYLTERFRVVFSDDGIAWHTGEIETRFPWSWVDRWIHDPELYLLLHKRQGEGLIIPRRALQAMNADERCAELLSRKLGPASK
jgi:hypothetical protein